MEKDTIGLKIAKYNSIGDAIKILRKHTALSIGELSSRISNNKYVLEFDYIDHEGVKTIISCYEELKEKGIESSLYELDDEPATIELFYNLDRTYSEISNEIDAEEDEE